MFVNEIYNNTITSNFTSNILTNIFLITKLARTSDQSRFLYMAT